jgi:hypothetical protein
MAFLKTVASMETGKMEYGKEVISLVNGTVVLILHRYKK